MLVCMADVHGEVAAFLLDEEGVDAAGPAMRALMVQRLEMIWEQVKTNLDPELGADPRWAEIGLRVLDREAKLYRLDRDKRVEPDEDEQHDGGVDRKALILGQLEELQARLS